MGIVRSAVSSSSPPLLLVVSTRYGNTGLFSHPLNNRTECKRALAALVIAAWAVPEWEQPIEDIRAHDVLEVAIRAKVKRVFANLAVEDSEGPRWVHRGALS